VRENAPDQRIFWTTAAEEIIKNSSLPGVRPLCRAWKESRRNRSGVPSQKHSQGKVKGERISTDECEREKREKCMMLSQAIFIPTAPPKSTARKICSAAREIDRTVREDVPAKLSDIPKIKQGKWHSVCFVARKIGKTVRENAPDQRIFWTTAAEEIIKDIRLPGVRLLYRAWKESRRNRSGVASQMHCHDKVNGQIILTDERERAKREKYMTLSQAIFILIALTSQPFCAKTKPDLPGLF
jgi:hypothetical protein